MDKKKLSIRALARKHGVPYTSLQKRIAGTVESMGLSSGGGKGNPHILSKDVEGKLNQFTLFAHFFQNLCRLYKLDQKFPLQPSWSK